MGQNWKLQKMLFSLHIHNIQLVHHWTSFIDFRPSYNHFFSHLFSVRNKYMQSTKWACIISLHYHVILLVLSIQTATLYHSLYRIRCSFRHTISRLCDWRFGAEIRQNGIYVELVLKSTVWLKYRWLSGEWKCFIYASKPTTDTVVFVLQKVLLLTFIWLNNEAFHPSSLAISFLHKWLL